jgi:drug/metabolite transporter (DMT)-like permease
VSRGEAAGANRAGSTGASRATIVAGLAVGIAAISTSPILVRAAAMPALALAFWRCLAGAVLLAPFAWAGRARRPAAGGVRGTPRRPSRQVVRSRTAGLGRGTPEGCPGGPGGVRPGDRGPEGSPEPGERARLLAAGACLAVHFALFNASLSFTTVASSATLVSCAPLFVGLGGRLLGEPPTHRAWLGIALAVAGAVVIGLGDAGALDLGGRALLGDAMAFAGAAAMAGYLLLGRVARRRLPLPAYAATVYGVAAAVLLPACLLTGAALGGYRAGAWLALAAIVAGPQLLGHTVFNGLLASVSATVVAVAILTEPVGATILAWLLLDELPADAFWLGAPPVLAGIWLAATGERAGLPAAPAGS